MKKSTDILLRIILVGSILGAIFFYYYGKFVTSRKVEVKSDVVLLPSYPEKKNKVKFVDNVTKNKVNQPKTNQIAKKKEIYKIVIPDYPIKNKIDSLKDFLKKYNNLVVNVKTVKKPSEFKRIFIGPFKSKFKLIKMENRLKELKIDPLRVKIRGVYYLHCGSFLFDEKADEFKKFLYKNGIKNIVIFKFKKPVTYYNVNIDNITETQLNDIKDFLNKLQISYNVY